jgi:hypothetical protein
MSHARDRLSALVVVIVSFMLAVGIASIFYYFKIQQNENYQNQLHFRELKLIADSLDKGVAQTINASKQQSNRDGMLEKAQSFISQFVDARNTELQSIEQGYARLRDMVIQIDELESRIYLQRSRLGEQRESELDKLYTQQSDALREQAALKQELVNDWDILADSKNSYNESWAKPLEAVIEAVPEESMDWLEAQCGSALAEACDWIEGIFDNVFDLALYENFDKATISSTLAQSIETQNEASKPAQKTMKKEIEQREKIVKRSKAASTTMDDASTEGPGEQKIAPRMSPEELDIKHLKALKSMIKRLKQAMKPFTKDGETAGLLHTINENRLVVGATETELENLTLKLNELRGKIAASTEKGTQTQPSAGLKAMIRDQQRLRDEMDSTLESIQRDTSSTLDQLDIFPKQCSYALNQNYDGSQRAVGGFANRETGDAGNRLVKACEAFTECFTRQVSYGETDRVEECNETISVQVETAKAKALSLFRAGTALRNANINTRLSDSLGSAFKPSLSKLYLKKGADESLGQSWQVAAKYSHNAALVVPFADLIETSLERHALVLLVDSKGNRLVKMEDVKIDAFQNGLEFNNAAGLLKQMFLQQSKALDGSAAKDSDERSGDSNTGGLPGISGFVDVKMAGEEYRVFISPYRDDRIYYHDGTSSVADNPAPVKADANSSASTETYYLIGFRSKSQLLSGQLAISNSIVLASLLGVVFIIVMLPLLRIRLVSASEAFSPSDFQWANVSAILLTVLLSLAVLDFWVYQQMKLGVESRSSRIFHQIKSSFGSEFKALNNIATAQWDSQKTPQRISTNNTLHDFYFDPAILQKHQSTPNGVSSQRPANESYFLENLFLLRGQGGNKGMLEGKVFWSTNRFARSGKPANLNKREYFRRANTCDIWYPNPGDNCVDGLFIERIFNLRDGRKTTQLSRPHVTTEATTNYDVLSFGGVLQTFFNPVLPPNYGFLVFENSTGTVLYHSEDSRSLVENFYVETDSDPNLRSLVDHWKKGAGAQSLTTTYRGTEVFLTLGELRSGIPWTLAVYFEKDELRTLNFSLAIGTLVILFLLVLAGYLAYRALPVRFKWKGINRVIPRTETGGNDRIGQYTRRNLPWLIGTSLGITAIVLSTLVWWLGDRYENLHKGLIAERVMAASISNQEYRELVVDGERMVGSGKKGLGVITCFLGSSDLLSGALAREMKPDICKVDKKLALITNNAADQGVHVPMPVSSLSQLLALRGDVLSKSSDYAEFYTIGLNPFDEETRVDSLLNTLAALLGLLLSFWGIRFIYTEWIGKRLLGLNVPEQFRIEGKEGVNRDFVTQCLFNANAPNRHLQIIRPSQTVLKACSIGAPEADKFLLLTASPTTIPSLLKLGDSPKTIFKNLKKGRKVADPESKVFVLVIRQLESLAMDPKLRMHALNLIEYLMSRKNLRLILLCEVAPLFRLIHQNQYPHRGGKGVEASSSEVLRWSNALREFRKLYDWTPRHKAALIDDQNLEQVLLHEASGWPEVEVLWDEFCAYHRQTKAKEDADNPDFPPLTKWHDEENIGKVTTCIESLAKHWKPDQIVEFFGAHAGPFYRFRWELCTKAERLLLYQLAMGHQPNPINLEPLEHLTRRGYVYYDRGWHLVNNSFTRFVLTAENPEQIAQWLAEASESTWKYLRIPIYAVVIALVAIVVYSASDALDSAVAILTGIIGLIPLAMRSFSIFKGGAAPASE